MLFGSAVLFALLLSGHSEAPRRLQTLPPEMWLREAMPQPNRADLIRRLPIEVKSMKVVGASGLGVFFPIMPGVSVGMGVTAYKVAPTQRAEQFVAAIRFRF